MRLSRRSRVFAAVLALVSVLFTQLAVASYLCPSTQISRAIEVAAASAAAIDHHDASGCEDLDAAEQPVPCHDLGQTRIQFLDKAELPNVPPFAATMLVQTVSHADQPTRSVVALPSDLFLTRATAPPLSIRNCCFRI